jgi:CheY-like chemotaxis protein
VSETASGPLVLVVDDDRAIRRSLCAVLVDEGYAVAQAANGQEALGLLRRGLRPRVMLLDLMMPVMDGMALLRALGGEPELAGIPILVITAGGEGEHPAVGAAAAVRGWLRKPVDLDQLLETVADCTRGDGQALTASR